jgi:uncharacterized protein (TIGR00369 family)
MDFQAISGWNEALGISFDEVTEDRCVGRLELTDRHMQPYGIVHGGVYTAMVEAVASMAAAVWAAGAGFPGAVGVNNNTDFIKAIREGVLIATATPIHRGRTQQIWSVDVVDEAEATLRAQGKVRLANVQNPDTVGT